MQPPPMNPAPWQCPHCAATNQGNPPPCRRCGWVPEAAWPPPPGVAPPYGAPPPDNTLGGLIPYKNSSALIAYYLGVFSLIPCLGLFLGIAALILGMKGLKYAKQYPQTKGQVHAWVGIILGGLCGLGNIVLLILFFVGISRNH